MDTAVCSKKQLSPFHSELISIMIQSNYNKKQMFSIYGPLPNAVVMQNIDLVAS